MSRLLEIEAPSTEVNLKVILEVEIKIKEVEIHM